MDYKLLTGTQTSIAGRKTLLRTSLVVFAIVTIAASVIALPLVFTSRSEKNQSGQNSGKKSEEAKTFPIMTSAPEKEHFMHQVLTGAAAEKKGQCIWYGECGESPNGKLNCMYKGPAKKLTDPHGLQILQTYCPDLYHGMGNTYTCCDTHQLITMNSNMGLPEQFFKRCPACYKNFLSLYCNMNCGPHQSDFLQINKTTPPAVTSVNYYVTHQYAYGMYNSCKDVQMPSADAKAISVFCGTTAEKCTPEGWLTYMGSTANGHAPFDIFFHIEQEKNITVNGTMVLPMDYHTVPCNASQACQKPACSCLDCEASCSPVPPPPPPAKHCKALNCWPFFRTEQIIITRPNNKTLVPHSLPLPSEEKVNYTSLFDKEFLHMVLDLQLSIQGLVAEYECKNVTLEDICYKPLAPENNNCTIMSILQYWQNDHTKLDRIKMDRYGFFVLADYLDHFEYCANAPTSTLDTTGLNISCLAESSMPVFPKISMGGFDGNIYRNSTALIITFVVTNHFDEVKNGKAEAWERVFIEFMKNYKSPNMTVTYSSDFYITSEERYRAFN